MAEEFKIPGLSESVKGVDALNKEFQKTIEILLKVSAEGQKATSAYRTVDSVKGIKEFEIKTKLSLDGVSTAYKRLNEVQQAQLKAYKDQQRASLSLLSIQKKEALETQKLKIKKQQITKASKQQALEELGLLTAYDKVLRKMNEAGKVIQNLNAKKLSGEKLSKLEVKSLKNSEIQFLKYKKAVVGADASIGRFQRNVGNYPKALSAAAGAARNLASAFGFSGGVYLVASALKDAFNRVREFDNAMQNIAGILRTSRDDISDLEQEIIKVAGASIKTSREVAGLAESLVTLGKSKKEIKDMLKPVTDLSIGLETTGADAAEFLVQTLNAFGAGSEEASKYADVIATIRTSTTLDFQKMRDSFQYLTPISRILNKDLAYTGAVIGILADNGLKAESAGRLLGTAQQKLAKQGRSLTDALEEINDAQSRGVEGVDLLKTASDLFGKQAAKVGIILAQNSELIEVNSQAIRDNGGALDDLVKEQMKSLENKLKALDASWEELILTIDNGKGSISGFFTKFTDLITQAIKSTTDLEKAQSKVFEITGEGKGFLDYLKNINILTRFISTDYDDLVELQDEFNKANDNISANGISTLQSMYNDLEEALHSNNDLTINQERLYQKQLVTIQKVIDAKKEETKSLQETAIALGFNEKELGNYADKIEDYTDSDLKKFIQANKNATKSVNELTKAELKAIEDKNKKRKQVSQDLKEFEIKEQIKRLNRVVSNEENSNSRIIKALQERVLLEMELESTSSDFRVKMSKLTGDELLLSEKELQSKLNDIIIKGQEDIKKASERKEDEDNSLDSDDGIDSRLHLINELEKAGQGTFEELSKLYDDDLDAFLKLAEAKLNITERYSEAQKQAMQDVFDTFGNAYGVDVDKFTTLFDGKKNTTQDYVNAAGEALIGLNNLTTKNYENDIISAQNKAESSLRFVEEGSAAESKIREDLAKREAEIRQKQAKQEKDQALFNIFIQTASAVVAALPNVPLSIAIGAIGALSAAKVASRELPAFWMGTEGTPSGQIMVNDDPYGIKGNNYKEVIKEPSGKLHFPKGRNVKMSVPKGSTVYPNYDSFNQDLDNILDSSGVMAFNNSAINQVPVISVNNTGATAIEIDRIMSKHFSSIQVNQTSIDKNGIKTLIKKGNSSTVIHNNSVSFKGFSV